MMRVKPTGSFTKSAGIGDNVSKLTAVGFGDPGFSSLVEADVGGILLNHLAFLEG